MNRLLRLPLPEPYVPSRIEAVRDRLRTKPKPPKAPAKRVAKAPSSRAGAKAQPKSAKAGKAAKSAQAKARAGTREKPTGDDRRRTAQAADRRDGGAVHSGGRQRQPSRRARPLEGQRYG
jgi:cell division protein FtsW